ncbi:hypothetical protein RhiirA4_470573 [Rhizophagus irregularis]|uniref:Uncharacterized protein n=1 Tax=Rhizophagus irregularis TaxID=588596 RepID=A0A2I1H1L6_9GLOM|nr:hypothetical protein RhiirA4_470573 [Rhizophagus irregularis]
MNVDLEIGSLQISVRKNFFKLRDFQLNGRYKEASNLKIKLKTTLDEVDKHIEEVKRYLPLLDKGRYGEASIFNCVEHSINTYGHESMYWNHPIRNSADQTSQLWFVCRMIIFKVGVCEWIGIGSLSSQILDDMIGIIFEFLFLGRLLGLEGLELDVFL